MNIAYNTLLYFVWFISTYYVVLLLIILFSNKDTLYEKKKFTKEDRKTVSVLVPAYNEEKKIQYTIDSLKRIDYDKIEFIVINDGSKDKTSSVVKNCIKGDSRFRFIDRKNNLGKAASLNEGISVARGEFIATMDADSVVEPKIFQKVLPYFQDAKTGAVTVSVLVRKPKGLLQKMFDLEYIIGLSLFLKLFSTFDSVFVTPGPFSVYRKSMLDEIGGFDPKNITEDLEIAYRIQAKHYKIANCLHAKVFTILPPTLNKIVVQRKRWYSGAIYTLAKHRKMLLNRKYGAFGFFVFFNYLLIFFGIILFLTTSYMGISKMVENTLHFQYTNFNFIERLKYFQWDILTYSKSTILGVLSFLFTLVILAVGIRYTKNHYLKKKTGIITYPFLFIFYQIFWLIAIYAVVRGKKVKWR